jgi:mitogen-activated protein kinase 1/3
LQFNPGKRITAEESLQHLYVNEYHKPEDEPNATPIPNGLFTFEMENNSEELKKLLYKEICDDDFERGI